MHYCNSVPVALCRKRTTGTHNIALPADLTHYSLPADLTHYSLPADLTHYSLPADLTHYSLPADLTHYSLPADLTHYSVLIVCYMTLELALHQLRIVMLDYNQQVLIQCCVCVGALRHTVNYI